MIHRGLYVLVFAGLLACTPSNPPAGVRDGDAASFVSEVQPIVVASCAFIGCHGREGMPLTLYAVDYLRLRDPEGKVDPARPTLDERALATGELDHNRRAFAARIGSRNPEIDRDRFLNKLIPLDQGGILHADIVVFEDPAAPELAILRRFLETVN